MTRRPYSDEERAAALAALMTGQALSAVAKEYNIPRTTLHSWRTAGRVYSFGGEQDVAIGELLVEYLRTSLTSLQAQAELFGDPDWIREQDAQQMGILHGIMTDKAVRLMEAFGRADDSDNKAGH